MNNKRCCFGKLRKKKKKHDLIYIFSMGADKAVKFQNIALKFTMCVSIDTNLFMLPNVCA